jgi:hypothetical protein
MPLVTEHLNGGVVTVRDPSELVPGEIQQGDECVYRLLDPAIYGRPGRTGYNATTVKDSTGATCPVKGLAWAPINGQTDQILAYGGDDNSHGTLWAGDFTSISGAATLSKVTGPGQVSVNINNSTTVNAASGTPFTDMVQGAHITGTGIPANAIVTVVNSSSQITISAATTGGVQTVTATFDMGIAVAPDDTTVTGMDVTKWGTSYFLAFGSGNMFRTYFQSRTLPTGPLADLLIARAAGLDPVVVQPTVTVNTAQPTGWSAVLGTGYYWFVVTEARNPDQVDEVEGTYLPLDDKNKKLGPVSAQITTVANQTITITRPAQINTGANGRLSTHWIVYMSPKQQDGTVTPSLAIFTRVATVPMTLTSITLTDSNTTQAKSPTAKTSVAGFSEWTNPTRLLNAPDGLKASTPLASHVADKLTTFGFSSSAPFNVAVTGVKVQIYGNTGTVKITLQTTGGKTTGPLFLTMPSSYGIAKIGDQFDTMGVAWSNTDFVNGTFEMILEGDILAQVDAIVVTVYYSGTSVNNNGRPFRVVTYRDSIGFTIDEPARQPPPPCTTLDVFQGSIVSNDIGNPAAVRWSLPGEPEAWPRPYQMVFNGRKSNAVTLIRRLNNVLLVATKEVIERVNRLPSETDTDFREGLSHEPLTEDHGCVGPYAAVRFTRPGGGTQMAYVSFSALYVTDGVTDTFLNRDIKISTFIDPAFIQNCVFRNYVKEQWLVLFYTPIGGTRNTKALIFCYDRPKEDGTLRAIGPITVSARSAAEATLNGVPILLTGHQFGGKIWVEDQGSDLTGYTTDGSTQVTAAPSIISRRFYPAGIDRNARTERQYVQHDAAGSSVNMTTVVMTAASTTLTRAAGWSGVTKGMRIVHTNMPGDAIVTNISGTTLTASQAAFETVTATVAFDTGAISITVRGQSVGTAISNVATTYSSTLTGGLLSTQQDAHAQAFDMKIEKVRLPDDTLFDLNTALRIHHITYVVEDAGKEQSRAGAL